MAANEGEARRWAVCWGVGARAPTGGMLERETVISSFPYRPRPDERVVEVVTLFGPYRSALEAQAARLAYVGAYPDVDSALANSWRWNGKGAARVRADGARV
jgi:hypothetical protein